MPWWGWATVAAAFILGGLTGAAVGMIVSAPRW